MCGRFTQRKPASDVAKAFELVDIPELLPRYNIAPTQDVPVIRLGDDERRHLSMVRWGLIPFWAKDAKIGASMINARADTVADRLARLAPSRRCEPARRHVAGI